MESASSASTTTVNSSGDGEQPAPPPAPMPAANGPPPFLVKTYDMVDDPRSDKVVSWSATNNSFVVWDSAEFAKQLLPKYFKHNNFSSFVRQLNTYLWDLVEKQGFRKVDPDRWEFANEGFLRGQKHLLKNIIRRKPAHGHPPHHQPPNAQSSSVGACVEVGKFGLEEEVERLKRDKNVLMQELVRLRQQQQTTDTQLQTMVQSLQGMEQRQQQMMSFLAKAVNSPGFLAQFMLQPNDTNHCITEGSKKRRLKQEDVLGDGSVGGPPDSGQIIKYQPLMNEAAKAMVRQIMKLDSCSRLEDNFGNAANSSSNRVSGVTLEEVPHTAGPTENVIIPDLAQIVPESNIDVMGPENEGDVFLDPASFTVIDEIPLEEIVSFSPNPTMEWDTSLLDDINELPGVSDPFWEKFLQSPPPVESEMDSTLADDIIPPGSETKAVENRWDKSQHMSQLTEQMGLLSSDVKKV